MKLQQRIMENFKMLEEMKRNLGLTTKMKVTHIGNTPMKNTFDLRTLNQEIIKKCRQCATEI